MERIELLQNKVEELKAAVNAKSGNKNPEYYKVLKEFRLVKYIYLMEAGAGVDQEMGDWFDSYLRGNTSKITVTVHRGDPIMELLQKYNDVKDVYNKIMKAAERAGLAVNTATGMIE